MVNAAAGLMRGGVWLVACESTARTAAHAMGTVRSYGHLVQEVAEMKACSEMHEAVLHVFE